MIQVNKVLKFVARVYHTILFVKHALKIPFFMLVKCVESGAVLKGMRKKYCALKNTSNLKKVCLKVTSVSKRDCSRFRHEQQFFSRIFLKKTSLSVHFTNMKRDNFCARVTKLSKKLFQQ